MNIPHHIYHTLVPYQFYLHIIKNFLYYENKLLLANRGWVETSYIKCRPDINIKASPS